MTLRVLEFYSGIGGLHFALKRARPDADVVSAFDWDQTACKVYHANLDSPVQAVDIGAIPPTKYAKFNADMWLLSPACQPYTVQNPDAKGAEDPRAKSFLYLTQTVLPHLAQTDSHPSYLLVENVAGFETSSTRQILLSTLRNIGYTTLEFLLTPLQFGIPNSRLRYYFLAKKAPLSFQHSPSTDIVHRHIPGQDSSWSDPLYDPESVETSVEIREYLDDPSSSDRHPVPDKVLTRWGVIFDIVKPSSRRSCCFTRGYTRLVRGSGSILQENDDLDTTTIFDKFLERQAAGDTDAVATLHTLRLRYFSPSELLRIFAFEPTNVTAALKPFTWPSGMSSASKYKLIGNSVNVKVVQELLCYLLTDQT